MTHIVRHHNQETHEEIEEKAKHTQLNADGQMVSPNGTGKLITSDTKTHDGHIKGMEFRYQKEFSEKNNLSQEEHDNIFEKSSFYQKEPADENFSHKFEEKDHNEGMQNVTMAAFGENHSIGEHIFINQNEDRTAGTIDYENPETGEINNLSTYELSSEQTIMSQSDADAWLQTSDATNEDINGEYDTNINSDSDLNTNSL